MSTTHLILLAFIALAYLLGRCNGVARHRKLVQPALDARDRYRNAVEDLDRWCGHNSPHARLIARHLRAHGEGLGYNAGTPAGDEACHPNGLRQQLTKLDAAIAASSANQDASDAAAYRAINTPEIADFVQAVHREALHQREKFGADGDAGKTDRDWFWLLGFLAGKALHNFTEFDRIVKFDDHTPEAIEAAEQHLEKALHHTITTAAACMNWHAARIGAHTRMRPGMDPGNQPWAPTITEVASFDAALAEHNAIVAGKAGA